MSDPQPEADALLDAIFAEPDDDTPRLVYADWLDDRDDPRGPFLRAEVEWAQPWKDGKRPGDVGARLRGAALGDAGGSHERAGRQHRERRRVWDEQTILSGADVASVHWFGNEPQIQPPLLAS